MAATLRLGHQLVCGTRHPQPLGVGAKPIADVGKAVERKDSGCKEGLWSGLPSDRERDLHYPTTPISRRVPPRLPRCTVASYARERQLSGQKGRWWRRVSTAARFGLVEAAGVEPASEAVSPG